MNCEPPPSPEDQGELVRDSQKNPLGALIDQMQRNWDRGDNAANDDLVVEIREQIRQQRAARTDPRIGDG